MTVSNLEVTFVSNIADMFVSFMISYWTKDISKMVVF